MTRPWARRRLDSVHLSTPFPDELARRPRRSAAAAGAGRRAARMQATERAIRAAALQLMTERGYEATSTDDIARAAGVSRRTFFNYFPTKEAVLFLPVEILPGMIGATLRARPLGEDPASSTVAAVAATFEQFAQFIGADAATMVRAQMRLV